LVACSAKKSTSAVAVLKFTTQLKYLTRNSGIIFELF